jgi:hypothetical protein
VNNDRLTIKSSMPGDRQLIIMMMKEILSTYAYGLKDKKISRCKILNLVLLILFIFVDS